MTEAMLTPENRSALACYERAGESKLARAWLEGWALRDVDRILSACTEDVTWSDPALIAPAVGAAAVRAFVVDTFRMFPDIETSADGDPCFSPGGNRVAQPWRMRGTWQGAIEPPGFAANGRPFDVRGVDLYDLRGGRIARITGNHNMLEWLEQLGLLPRRDSRALRWVAGAQRLLARLSQRQAP
jgi:steroid delta-isomerase-like uncharacterized protein